MAIGFSLGLGLSSPVRAAGGGATELFPDPTLAHVTDSTDGWSLDGAFAPLGGAGPGLAVTDNEDQAAALVGADDTAFAAAVANNSTKSVAITFTGYVQGDINVIIKDGTPVTFAPGGNTTVTHNVTAGASGSSFRLVGSGNVGTFNITAIHVT